MLRIGIGINQETGGIAECHYLRAGVVEDAAGLAPVPFGGAIRPLPRIERYLPINGQYERAEGVEMPARITQRPSRHVEGSGCSIDDNNGLVVRVIACRVTMVRDIHDQCGERRRFGW